MSASFSVAIVDDDPFITASLATILGAESDIDVVARGSNGEEAVEIFEQLAPDVLLMDIQMPSSDGLSAAERIIGEYPEARVVLLTTFADDDYIVRALRIGAKGYLVKQDVATIAPALRSVMAGQSVLGEEVIGKMGALVQHAVPRAGGAAPACDASDAIGNEREAVANASARGDAPPESGCGAPRPSDSDGLTDRERAIVELVAQGLDNREIAATLYLGEGTVRNHVSAILQKLRLKNRTQIAIWFYRDGR